MAFLTYADRLRGERPRTEVNRSGFKRFRPEEDEPEQKRGFFEDMFRPAEPAGQPIFTPQDRVAMEERDRKSAEREIVQRVVFGDPGA